MPSHFPAFLDCAADVRGCAARAEADAAALRQAHPFVTVAPLAPLILSSVLALDRPARLPHCLTCSNHFHSVCSEETERRICGRVADAAAQLGWNALFGERSAALARARAGLGPGGWEELAPQVAKEHALVCFDCPRDLMPIHITVEPDPVCYWSPLRHVIGGVGPSFPPPVCPCLDAPVLRSFTTHGGHDIDVRECNASAVAAAAAAAAAAAEAEAEAEAEAGAGAGSGAEEVTRAAEGKGGRGRAKGRKGAAEGGAE